MKAWARQATELMKQIIQDVRSGETSVREIPDPISLPNQVIAATQASVVSAGTERYVVDLARKSLLGKARQRPDQVRRVLQKMREEGVIATATQVFAKLDEPMPLGYSAAGIVLECGRGVQELKPGDRIAMAAPHASVVSVPRNLCAKIPDGVTFDQAAYTSIASIALQGVRLASVTLGERVLVIGLGLLGQIAVALLKAQGCRVFGIDLDPAKLDLARQFGADEVAMGAPVDAIKAFSGGAGVDAVVITASTPSNEPIELAAEVCRQRGRIVLVGVVGLNVPRDPFFRKELQFTVSFSMGPGRTDPIYEEKGIDYPIGFARWTAKRNMEAVLDLMAGGKLPVEKLTTHTLDLDRAAEAYELITTGRERSLGIVIRHPEPEPPRRTLVLPSAKPVAGKLGLSLIGVGNFARLIMVPQLKKATDVAWRGICSAKGMNAEHTGRNVGFAFATTDTAEVFRDKETSAVFIATRHDLHAELVIAALRAGKHVFVEKPLCIRREELEQIRATVEELGDRCPILTVGFNRRFAPATEELRAFFGNASPLSVGYRFSVPPIPPEVWVHDDEVGGGRIIGEACHAIDTCTAITGSTPVEVYAQSAGSFETLGVTDDRVFITVRHENGSISAVSYQAGGDRGFPNERIEVFGGGRTGVIDNWNKVELWSKGKATSSSGGKDRGHANELSAFVDACRTGRWPIPWRDLYAVSWASIAAVESLRDGVPVRAAGEL